MEAEGGRSPSPHPGDSKTPKPPQHHTPKHHSLLNGIVRFVSGPEQNKSMNTVILDPTTIAYTAGNYVVLHDLAKREQSIIIGRNKGLGAIAVHPSGTSFAVGERGIKPRILVYSYPKVKLLRILRHGTEEGYTALSFDKDGKRLASVGTYPDYTLTIWDWMQSQVLLKNKAFSQDIWTINFSPFQPTKMITSGVGHIRFWKMESTFTGLKLKGDIGKFGAIELSDISGFAELPNGLCVSGSESGYLLGWEAGLLKAQYGRQPSRRPAHDGPIECVILDTWDKMIISAGHDGCVRWWNRRDFEREVINPSDIQYLAPIKQIKLPGQIPIRSLFPLKDHFFVTTTNGHMHKLDYKTDLLSHLLTFPSSTINSLAIQGGTNGLHSYVPSGTSLIAIGCQDRCVYLFNSATRRFMLVRQFIAPVTSVAFVPEEVDTQGKRLIVGCEDGTIKIVEITIPPEIPEPEEVDEDEVRRKEAERLKRRKEKRIARRKQIEEEEAAMEEETEEKGEEAKPEEESSEEESSEEGEPVKKRKRMLVVKKAMASKPIPTVSILKVFKPHTDVVSCITFSPTLLPDASGDMTRIVVTASRDGNVFFFALPQNVSECKPIGFVHVTGEVTVLGWSQVDLTQEIVMKNGWEQELRAKSPITIDEMDETDSTPPQPQSSTPLSYSAARLSEIPNELFILATCRDGSIHEIPIPPIIPKEIDAETFILATPDSFNNILNPLQPSPNYPPHSPASVTVPKQPLEVPPSTHTPINYQILQPNEIDRTASVFTNPIFTKTDVVPYETLLDDVLEHDRKVLFDKLMNEEYERLKKEAESNMNNLAQLLGDDDSEDKDSEEEKEEEEKNEDSDEEEEEEEEEENKGPRRTPAEEKMWEKAKLIVANRMPKLVEKSLPKMIGCETMDGGDSFGVVKMAVVGGTKTGGIYCFGGKVGKERQLQREREIEAEKEKKSRKRGDKNQQSEAPNPTPPQSPMSNKTRTPDPVPRTTRTPQPGGSISTPAPGKSPHVDQSVSPLNDTLVSEISQFSEQKDSKIVFNEPAPSLPIGIYRIPGLTCYTWSPGFAFLVTGDEEGRVAIHFFAPQSVLPESSHPLLSKMTVLWGKHVHNTAVTSVAIVGGTRIVSGARDGSVVCIDIGTEIVNEQVTKLEEDRDKKIQQVIQKMENKPDRPHRKPKLSSQTIQSILQNIKFPAVPLVYTDPDFDPVFPFLMDALRTHYKPLDHFEKTKLALMDTQQPSEPKSDDGEPPQPLEEGGSEPTPSESGPSPSSDDSEFPSGDIPYIEAQCEPPPKEPKINEDGEEEEDEEIDDWEDSDSSDDDDDDDDDDEDDPAPPKEQLPGGNVHWKRAEEALFVGLQERETEEDDPDQHTTEKKEETEEDLRKASVYSFYLSPVESTLHVPLVVINVLHTSVSDMEKDKPLNEYCLEEKRRKQDERRTKDDGERKKQATKQRIQRLREQLTSIQTKNKLTPASAQLSPEDLEADQGLRLILERESEKQLEEMRREALNGTAKAAIALKKVKARYVDNIENMRVTVRGFKNNHTVSTFRTVKLPPHILRKAHSLFQRAQQQQQSRKNRQLGSTQQQGNKRNRTQTPQSLQKERTSGDTPLNYTVGSSHTPLGTLNTRDNLNYDGKPNMTPTPKNDRGNDTPTSTEQRNPHSHTNSMASGVEVKKAGKTMKGKQTKQQKQKERDRKLRERENEWMIFNARKPKYPDPAKVGAGEAKDSDIFEPEDQTLIDNALKNIGEHKLKTEPDFVVPEHERPNAEKKEREILFHQYGIHGVQLRFNEFVLRLRTVKMEKAELLRKIAARVNDINRDINEVCTCFCPSLDATEFPEKIYDVSEPEIKLYEKRLIQKQEKDEEKKKQESGGQVGLTAVGKKKKSDDDGKDEKDGDEKKDGDGDDGQQEEDEDIRLVDPWDPKSVILDETEVKPFISGQPQTLLPTSLENTVVFPLPQSGALESQLTQMDLRRRELVETIPRSPLEMTERAMQIMMLRGERRRLMEASEQIVKQFDNQLDELRKSRFRLMSEMKAADLRLITLFEEFNLLKEFEEQDEVLSQAYIECRSEKAEIAKQMLWSKKKMELKKKELLELRAKEEEMRAKFDRTMADHKGEDSPFFSKMLKLFEHNIKKKVDENESEDSDSSVSTIDSNIPLEDQMRGASGETEDAYDGSLPPDCPQQLYDDIVKLSEENRPNVEERQYLEQSIRDLTEKTQSLQTRMKKAEETLRSCDEKIIVAQQAKQDKLNRLSSVVAVHAHQIDYMAQIDVRQLDNGTYPVKPATNSPGDEEEELYDVAWALRSDFSQATVCSNEQIEQLFRNIENAQQNKQGYVQLLHQRKGELKSQHQVLKEVQKEFHKKQEELKAVQILMFGQEVSVQDILKWTAPRSTEKLKQSILKEEQQLQQELAEENEKLRMYKERLADVTRANTARLKKLEEGLREQNEIEKSLGSAMQKVTAEFPSIQTGHAEKTEKEKLQTLLQSQAAQIEELRQEIFALRRKGDSEIFKSSLMSSPGKSPGETEKPTGSNDPVEFPLTPSSHHDEPDFKDKEKYTESSPQNVNGSNQDPNSSSQATTNQQQPGVHSVQDPTATPTPMQVAAYINKENKPSPKSPSKLSPVPKPKVAPVSRLPVKNQTHKPFSSTRNVGGTAQVQPKPKPTRPQSALGTTNRIDQRQPTQTRTARPTTAAKPKSGQLSSRPLSVTAKRPSTSFGTRTTPKPKALNATDSKKPPLTPRTTTTRTTNSRPKTTPKKAAVIPGWTDPEIKTESGKYLKCLTPSEREEFCKSLTNLMERPLSQSPFFTTHMRKQIEQSSENNVNTSSQLVETKPKPKASGIPKSQSRTPRRTSTASLTPIQQKVEKKNSQLWNALAELYFVLQMSETSQQKPQTEEPNEEKKNPMRLAGLSVLEDDGRGLVDVSSLGASEMLTAVTPHKDGKKEIDVVVSPMPSAQKQQPNNMENSILVSPQNYQPTPNRTPATYRGTHLAIASTSPETASPEKRTEGTDEINLLPHLQSLLPPQWDGSILLRASVGCAGDKNKKRSMEDDYIGLNVSGAYPYRAYAGVFDGHSMDGKVGFDAAKYAKTHLFSELVREYDSQKRSGTGPFGELNYESICTNAFEKIDNQMRIIGGVEQTEGTNYAYAMDKDESRFLAAGTTAGIVCLLSENEYFDTKGNPKNPPMSLGKAGTMVGDINVVAKGEYRLLSANIGDTEVYLCSSCQSGEGSFAPVELSYRHHASDKDEVKRCKDGGAFVQGSEHQDSGGTCRVNGIAVTRAFGDFASPQTIATPFVHMHQITHNVSTTSFSKLPPPFTTFAALPLPQWALVGCDGFYDVIPPKALTTLIPNIIDRFTSPALISWIDEVVSKLDVEKDAEFEEQVKQFTFYAKAHTITAQQMASALLKACLEVYDSNGPTEIAPDAIAPTHKDNVSVSVIKLNWVGASNEKTERSMGMLAKGETAQVNTKSFFSSAEWMKMTSDSAEGAQSNQRGALSQIEWQTPQASEIGDDGVDGEGKKKKKKKKKKKALLWDGDDLNASGVASEFEQTPQKELASEEKGDDEVTRQDNEMENAAEDKTETILTNDVQPEATEQDEQPIIDEQKDNNDEQKDNNDEQKDNNDEQKDNNDEQKDNNDEQKDNNDEQKDNNDEQDGENETG
ncbi:putative Cilia- and flagella-associated protein 44 [Blattamonas nauphoetae]|uniref:Cilia- and flagella-associated protein 44 n=1 Tax=Blattamonas nauphoetae TaxID=2049346 RepID=A0ABQ9YM55_9EUKA|nr:putative Cilia- and flagella-associated protein 44 [Blattamonas nauphoetae]